MHTDSPEAVFSYADPVLGRHRIALVPLQVVFGDETFRGRVELKPEDFYRRPRGARELPTTSQPTPADFVRVLRDARAEAEEVVAVLLSAALSGTFASAQAAVRAGGISGVHLVDSRSASLGLGMLGLPRVLALPEKRLTPRPKVVRFGVAHAEAPDTAERVRNALVAAYQPRDCFVTLATGVLATHVLATHVGPGARAIFYQVEDGPGGEAGDGRGDEGTTQ